MPAAAAGEDSAIDGIAVAIASICARSALVAVPFDPPPFTTPAMLAMMPFLVLRRSISPWSSAIFASIGRLAFAGAAASFLREVSISLCTDLSCASIFARSCARF